MLRALLLLLAGTASAFAQSIVAPDTAKVGGNLPVTVSGSKSARDFVTIVSKGAREGAYDAYQYVAQPTVILQAPAKAGEYEVRLLGAASPYPTLARRALKLEDVAAALDAPAQVSAGKPFEVKWTGPNNTRDYVGIGDAKRNYVSYVYTRNGNPITLTAPDTAGAYELRYFLGNGDAVVATRPIVVGAVSASVSGPAHVGAGARFSVTWQGPNNPRDFITLVKAGTADKQYDRYEYTSKGSTLELRAPDQPGEYELRYATAQTYATLARARITVTPISATIQAPASAVAGTSLDVSWKGPNNSQDYITIVPKGAREGVSGNYGYTAKGNPTKVLAPLAAGDYELRYSNGQSHSTLASAAIRITPSQQEPGFVSATLLSEASGRAVEIVLDASGSMLQRIGAQRRIDIAKQTLTTLTSSILPANTPFALRVFGREVDSCQTDLEISLAPLNAAAVGAKIGALEAKNNAKTPIGASLDLVASDLSAATGERLVIVLTDGEETCGGDPAASIDKLRKASSTTRVSIVGFAIDDAKLAASFRHWSDLGAGAYFDAKDAAGLATAMSQALQATFELVDAQGTIVAEGLAGGASVTVAPGSYSARIKGGTGRGQTIVVKAKETTAIRF